MAKRNSLVWKVDPSLHSTQTMLDQVEDLLNQNRAEEVLPLIDALLDKNPRDALYLYLKGFAQMQLGALWKPSATWKNL